MTVDESILSAFVRGESSPGDLLRALDSRVAIQETEDGAIEVSYTGPPVQHVTFRREDVVREIDRAIAGEKALEDVASWAGLMTLFDFFELEDDSQPDDVWDALSRLSHPEQANLSDAWRLRDLRQSLVE